MPHEDKCEHAAAPKRRQVHLLDHTTIQQIEFAMMDVFECNQSLRFAVTVAVCSAVHCSYSYLIKSNDADFVNGGYCRLYLYDVNQAFIAPRK